MNDDPTTNTDNTVSNATSTGKTGWKLNFLRTWTMDLFDRYPATQPLAILLALALVIITLGMFGINREGLVVFVALGAFVYALYLLVHWAHSIPPSTLTPDLTRGLKFIWYLGLSALLLAFSSVFFDWPLPWKARFSFGSLPPSPTKAPSELTMVAREGYSYFRQVTEAFGKSEDAKLNTSRLLTVKYALEALSSDSEKWRSVVLELASPVEHLTEGATYYLETRDLANHGTDYERADPPIVEQCAWIVRTIDGQLEHIPVGIRKEFGQTDYRLQFILPLLRRGDTFVIAIQRKEKADPLDLGKNRRIVLKKL